MNEDGSDYIYAGKLGKWVKTQRRIKKGTRGKQKLKPEREALLQALADQSESYRILSYLVFWFIITIILLLTIIC